MGGKQILNFTRGTPFIKEITVIPSKPHIGLGWGFSLASKVFFSMGFQNMRNAALNISYIILSSRGSAVTPQILLCNKHGQR